MAILVLLLCTSCFILRIVHFIRSHCPALFTLYLKTNVAPTGPAHAPGCASYLASIPTKTPTANQTCSSSQLRMFYLQFLHTRLLVCYFSYTSHHVHNDLLDIHPHTSCRLTCSDLNASSSTQPGEQTSKPRPKPLVHLQLSSSHVNTSRSISNI